VTTESKKIPFEVEISRVIELLATQIYQSPLALLRENTQNAFDAVLIRRSLGLSFEPRIDVNIWPNSISVIDNGVGMTPAELEANYWRAGSSGKNTPEARAAGVVGTFGIGAMANFGIAESLAIETESAREPMRTRSEVSRAELSTSEECITLQPLEPTGSPGTKVTATLEPGSTLTVEEAVQYITQFVEFVDDPVYVNGSLVSGRTPRDVLPSERAAWKEQRSGVELAGLVTADVEVLGLANGELRVVLDGIETLPSLGRPGRAVLIQGTSAIRTLRNGFGLATVSVPSLYRFGGVVDLPALQPTAGREALEVKSNDFLQRLFAAIDEVISEIASVHEETLENQAFLSWVVRGGRYHLCGGLQVSVEPGQQQRRLADLSNLAQPLRYYGGSDQQLIQAYASEDHPLVVVSRRSPRRDCELGYLRQAGAEQVSDQPTILELIDGARVSVELGAIAVRITRVLAEDYFAEVTVRFARMSHGVPLLVDRNQVPPTLLIDPEAGSLAPLAELYRNDFVTFGPFVKDFVRAHVFPKVKELVPSSTREGAEAFLRRLRGRRELFEIDWTDREDLEAIWEKYAQGEINLTEAAQRSRAAPRRSVVVVRQDQAATIDSVVPALEDSNPDAAENGGDEFGPLPPVDRREAPTDALVLTGDQTLNGYSCFLALSDRAQKESGEFFFQPHTTSIVWGGQKILFVFQHHSGRFGLYYDVQCPRLVADKSGGRPFRTSTLLLKNRVFIPVPAELAHSVVPGEGERIRLDVRCDVLYLDAGEGDK
jgi:molecular chaperone HtpG